jgi:hypothetical protein
MWWLLALSACEPVSPCDDYVDYLCTCHEEVDCDEVTVTYGKADPAVQDECAVLLDEQQAEDDRNGVDCAF